LGQLEKHKMGTSFISPQDEQTFGNQFNDLHATWARPISIFRQAQQVIIATNPAHNFIYDTSPTNDIVANIPVSGVFQARIAYNKQQTRNQFSTDKTEQVNLKMFEGDVRIKLDPTGAAFLEGASRVQFDGSTFEIINSQRPHGLFAPNFYTYFLKKLN
jgi:hypothetical protein